MTNITDITRPLIAEDIINRVNVKVKRDVNEVRNSLDSTQKTLADFMVETIGDLSDLQDQIDGNITTYYYNGVPTLNNLPASEWTTTELKNEHLNDLYYDQATGKAYRFIYTELTDTYSWEEIGENSIIEALARANAAQDTADNKRRVFVVTPTIPYDIGDLWLTDNNELYRCQTSASSGTYNPAHWIVATKYTDDTIANQAKAYAEGVNETVTTSYVSNASMETWTDKIVAKAYEKTTAEYGSRIETIESTTRNITGPTYNKTEIEQIITHSNPDSGLPTVTAVVSSDATYDIDGMHYNRSDAPTSATINQVGLRVNKKNNNIEGDKILFAGYVDTSEYGTMYQGDSIVYTKNLVSNGYATLGQYGRFEKYEGSNGEKGISLFISGGD